jgi:hypothetical protein
MAALALSDFLQDFGRRPGQAAAKPPVEERKPVPAPTFATQEEVEQKVSAAVARAEEATTERVSRIYEDTLQAERDQHSAEVSALRTTLGTEAGARIAARLDEIEGRLTALAAASVARILSSFLDDEMQRRSIDRLVAMIRETLADREAVRIQVSGPQFLFEPLARALGDRAGGVEFVEAAGFDLSVNVDGSLFETRLGEWAAAIEEARR